MENIAFVIWVCFWPLVCSISYYLSAKTRLISGEETPTKTVLALAELINVIIWIAIANLL